MQNFLASRLTQREWLLLAASTALFILAVFGPDTAQPLHQHVFADSRRWVNLPNATDVLSNFAFAAWGVAGLTSLHRLFKHQQANTEQVLAALFFLGLMCTAAASGWYHLQPDDAGLGVDRMGMVLAFAGLLGLAVAGRISHRAGVAIAVATLLFGPLSIWYWLSSGNVLPWLVIQFGGMALILVMAFIKPSQGTLAVRWGMVVAVYFLAKLLELGDHEIYAWTGELVSGHSLKHLVAGVAAWPVLHALVWANALLTQTAVLAQKNRAEFGLPRVRPLQLESEMHGSEIITSRIQA